MKKIQIYKKTHSLKLRLQLSEGRFYTKKLRDEITESNPTLIDLS